MTSKLDVKAAQVQVGKPVSDVQKCILRWRQGVLWVGSTQQPKLTLPALENDQLLVNCLQRSSTKLVCLDLSLSETLLKKWADVCEAAKEKAFIRVPSGANLLHQRHSLSWWLKRGSDWLIAALLLLLISPLMITLAILVKLSSPGPIFFSQWRVGERGKLFRVLKFRSMVVDAESQHRQVMGNQNGLHKRKDDPRVTPLGRLMRKYSLDELPQLINVLRGEMSLVGPRPWALYDAMRLRPEDWHRLSALPGITGPWQISGRSDLLDINLVTRLDLQYLRTWSLKEDFRILLMTIPRVLSGFGAY